MCLFGAATMVLMYTANNFYFALAMYALWFLLSDGFVAPVLDMMGLAAPVNAKGQIFGYFITIVSIDGLITPLFVTHLLGYKPNHERVAMILLLNTVIPCVLAAICFWMAGYDFERTMLKHKEEKIAGMAKSMSVVPEMMSIHLTHGVDAELVENAMKLLGFDRSNKNKTSVKQDPEAASFKYGNAMD